MTWKEGVGLPCAYKVLYIAELVLSRACYVWEADLQKVGAQSPNSTL